jgi:S-layer protein
VTTALAATSVINAGAGNDTVTLSATPGAGATIGGGDGTDTIAMAAAQYTAISAFAAADLAKITGFETLSITGAALAGASTTDLSKIAGLTNFQTIGVTTATTATVSNVGANSTITETGDIATNNGTLAVSLKDATGSNDSVTVNLTEKAALAAASNTAVTTKLTVDGIENLTVNTAVKSTTAGVTDAKATYTLQVTNTDTALTKLVVTGSQALSFTSDAAFTKLAVLDGSANTGGVTFNAAAAAASSAALTITGSATAGNSLTGGAGNDIVIGGAKADTITGGAGGDTLTGKGGNDTFVFAAGDSTIGTGTFDTITDFVANTFGAGLNGAVDTHGAFGVAAASLTGDVIKVIATGAAATDVIKTFVASNAADATTFLANNHGAAIVSVALDSSNSNLYIDNTGDGVADFYIHLTGVTTINAAAILLG